MTWPNSVTVVSLSDYDKVQGFYEKTPFAREPDVLRQQIEQGLVVAIFCQRQIVAAGFLDSFTGVTALIAGIFTLPSYRGRGYALKVVQALVHLCLSAHKLSVLYADNPVALRVYRRAGFSPLARELQLWQARW